MSTPPLPSLELEPRVNEYLRRLHQIDDLLDGPVRTLRALWHSPTSHDDHGRAHFPLWVSARSESSSPDVALTTGMCVATLQRLEFAKRSLPWIARIGKEEEEEAKAKRDAARGPDSAPAAGVPTGASHEVADPGDAGGGPAAAVLPDATQAAAGAEQAKPTAGEDGSQREESERRALARPYQPRLKPPPGAATPDDAPPDAPREVRDALFFVACCRRLESETFGFLNPLTAAQVFRVLMQQGEEAAHSGMGCLAFFAMVWPQFREGAPFDYGVRIEPGEASAYATNKCLLPLLELRELCLRRGHVFAALAANVASMRQAAGANPRGTRDEWTFYAELDELRRNLLEVSHLSIAGRAFKRAEEGIAAFLATGRPCTHDTAAAKEVRDAAPSVTPATNANGAAPDPAPPTDVAAIFQGVLDCLLQALKTVETTSDWVHEEATTITNQIGRWILDPLFPLPNPTGAAADDTLVAPVADRPGGREAGDERPMMRVTAGGEVVYEQRFPFARGATPRPGCADDAYLTALGEAARETVKLCNEILAQLKLAKTLGIETRTAEQVEAALRKLGVINRTVADKLLSPVPAHAAWCEGVVNREVAHASAGNFTEFNVSELVAALLIAVRANRLTRPQAADAIAKALLCVQSDGSWSVCHPYFTPDGDRGMLPPAADVVWTLVAAIERFPDIDVADEHLFLFLDWLERTQVHLTLERCARAAANGSPPTSGEYAAGGEAEAETRVGWGLDRVRYPEPRIHLLTTSFAVNALLALRELIEHRLWEICERRFTIVPTDEGLKTMDPVDLSLPHRHRLHGRLAGFIRHTQGSDGPKLYAMVLHGPPGSSKTTVASRLAHDLWHNTRRWGRPGSRLVRITPADFTGQGEDRIDSEAKLIFRLLGNLRGVTILFDEIDDLLRKRVADRPLFLDLVIPAMLNRLQDLRSACEKQDICFLFGTNYVDRIEPALMRQGRIDAKFSVTYADYTSRVALVEKALAQYPGSNPEDPAWKAYVIRCAAAVAARTGGWNWNSLRAATDAVRKHLGKAGGPVPSDGDAWVNDAVENAGAAPDLEQDYNSRVGPSPELSMEYVRFIVCRETGSLDHAIAQTDSWIDSWPTKAAATLKPEVIPAAAKSLRDALDRFKREVAI